MSVCVLMLESRGRISKRQTKTKGRESRELRGRKELEKIDQKMKSQIFHYVSLFI